MKKFRLVIVLGMVISLLIGCGKQAVEDEPVAEKPVLEKQVQDTVVTESVQDTVSAQELTQESEKVEEVLEVIAEGDSVDIFYMVKPDDYLAKIAKNEYDNYEMWKMIYKWNRTKIGDNPNLIYPYHEFLLKKPKDNAEPLEYDYYEYRVKQTESLWTIAGKEYDNNYAWIVILRDNADVLGSDLRKIAPGTVLQLRTAVFN